MEKGKLGLSISLMMFIVLLSGVLGYIPVILIAGYILIKEENILLRKTAVFSLMIALVVGIISFILSSLSGFSMFFVNSDIFSFLAFPMVMIVKFISGILELIIFAKNILLIVLSVLALSSRPLNLSFLDKFCDKHL